MNDIREEAPGQRRGAITVSREFSVAVPKDEGGYVILQSDWDRIRRMVQSVVPVQNWFQVSGSICIGVAVAAAFSLIGFASSRDVPPWANFTDWCALVCGAVLAIAFFVLDNQQQRYTVQKTSDVTDEMDRIIQRCERSGDASWVDRGLVIKSARYGALDRWRDVTALVRSKVQDGVLEIPVSNAELGGDPIKDVPKLLEVEFSFDGQSRSRSVSEGQLLSFRDG